MIWTNPLLLAGILAAVLPFVLHLLGRARARTVDWGALDFVARPGSDSAPAWQWRQRFLLVLRALAIALLAVSLARPRSAEVVTAVDGSSALVIVLDASPSMNHAEWTTTRFEIARKAALDRLAQLKQGDQAGLVVLGAVPSADVALTPDLQSIASQIASLSTGIGSADQADGERRARSMLADAGVEGGEIVLIGDRQRSAWELLQQASNDTNNVRVIALPIGSTDDRNAYVESIELLNPPAISGVVTRAAITVVNDGDVPQGALRLTVSSAGQASTRTIAVDPHGRTRVIQSFTPANPGAMVLTAAIEPTGQPNDDTMHLSFDVASPPRVLQVIGRSTTQPSLPPAWAKLLKWSAGVPDEAADDDVFILAGDIPDGLTVSIVERWVAAGGTLLLTPATSQTPELWNQRLWKNGFGLAPAASAVVGGTGAAPDWPAFMTADAPALPSQPAAPRTTWRFSPAGSETVLCSAGGFPMLIERPFGRGKVLTLARALSPIRDVGSDGDAMIVHALIRHLIAKPMTRNLDVGVPMEAWFASNERDRFATVLRPDGQFDRVNVLVANGATYFRYSRTDLPGRYVVRVGDRSAMEWIIRPDQSESTLKLLSDDELSEMLKSTAVRRQAETLPPRAAPDWSLALLACVAVALGVEMLVANVYKPKRRPA
ncbi:MAG: BatA domain-containing protein [Tepidisphaeraceae bacterium]